MLFTAIVGTLAHFLYQWSGENLVVALFTPVNESTWEHLKLLFFPMIFYSIFEAFLFRNRIPELFYANVAGALTGILSVIVLFYTYTGIWGTNCLAADITVFLVSVLIAFLTGYFLLEEREKLKRFKWLLLLALVLCTIAFFFFTWNPPDIGLFRNP